MSRELIGWLAEWIKSNSNVANLHRELCSSYKQQNDNMQRASKYVELKHSPATATVTITQADTLQWIKSIKTTLQPRLICTLHHRHRLTRSVAKFTRTNIFTMAWDNRFSFVYLNTDINRRYIHSFMKHLSNREHVMWWHVRVERKLCTQ